MKRFLIFCLIGPLLGLFLLMEVGVYVTHRPFSSLTTGIPFAYLLGVGPALVCAFTDWKLETTIRRWDRAGVVFCIGYVATFLMGALLFSGMRALIFAGFGAIPAAVCSLLSNVKLGRSAQ